MKKFLSYLIQVFVQSIPAYVRISKGEAQVQKRVRQEAQQREKARMLILVLLGAVGAFLALFWDPRAVWAANPQPMQMSFPDAGNSLAVMMREFHDYYLLPVCFGISIFVLVLMIYVVWRFSEKRNPVPSATTHNIMLEVVWTVVPVLILAILVVPSMRLLYASDKALDYEFTIKITGNQWYWNYEYPDHDNILFDSYMIPEDELLPGQKRLMEVDNPLVIPVDTPVRMQFTSADVLHNWSVSEFAIRVDTVPGQLNEVPLHPVFETGTYYGFCSELCGDLHSFMPITVKVVTKEEFKKWVEDAKVEFADASSQNAPLVQLAMQ